MSTPPYQQQWLDRGADRLGLQWYPEPARPAGTLALLWPAMGVPAGYYRPFATALGRAGVAVVVADLRGTGASTPRPSRRSRYGYADLVDDVAAGVATVTPRLAGRRLVLIGHSLGGQLCLLHLARTGGADVAGLALVAVGLPYWRLYRHRSYGVWAFAQGINLTATVLGYWPGWGFGGRQARGVIRDWAYTARHGRFPPIAGVDPAPALAALTTPVLGISLAPDRYTPPATVDQVLALLPKAPVSREHYPGDHFSWARAADGPVAARVAAFARDPG